MVLDGHTADVPIDTRVLIVNAWKYQELHHAAGYFDFQLRRTSCIRTLGRLCCAADYPSPPDFDTCSALQLQPENVCPFLDDPISGPNGQFLSPEDVQK